jgi:hypothetical protein
VADDDRLTPSESVKGSIFNHSEEKKAKTRDLIAQKGQSPHLKFSIFKAVGEEDRLQLEFQGCAGWGGESVTELFATLTSLFTHIGIHVAFKDCALESLSPLGGVKRLCSLRGENLTVADMPALPPRFRVDFTKGWPGAAAIPDALADGKRLAQV